MLGINLGPLPRWIDAEVFFATLFTMWDAQCPRVSGNMASYNDYEVHGQSAYFWNNCEYAGVQDAHFGKGPGGYYGWFTIELPARYNRLLENWSSIIKED